MDPCPGHTCRSPRGPEHRRMQPGTAPPSFPAFPEHAGLALSYLLFPVPGLPAVTLRGPQSDTLCVAPAFRPLASTSSRPSGRVVCLSRQTVTRAEDSPGTRRAPSSLETHSLGSIWKWRGEPEPRSPGCEWGRQGDVQRGPAGQGNKHTRRPQDQSRGGLAAPPPSTGLASGRNCRLGRERRTSKCQPPTPTSSVTPGPPHCGLHLSSSISNSGPRYAQRTQGSSEPRSFLRYHQGCKGRIWSPHRIASCRRNLPPWYFMKQAAANFPNARTDALKTATSTRTPPCTVRFSVLTETSGLSSQE